MSGWVFLGWTSTKLGLMCLAQWHNAVMPVRLEVPALRSGVKHSAIEPLRLRNEACHSFWVVIGVSAWRDYSHYLKSQLEITKELAHFPSLIDWSQILKKKKTLFHQFLLICILEQHSICKKFFLYLFDFTIAVVTQWALKLVKNRKLVVFDQISDLLIDKLTWIEHKHIPKNISTDEVLPWHTTSGV